MRIVRKLTVTALIGGAGSVLFSVRNEVRRYVLIRRSASDPSAVGHSVTPQGNEAVLGETDDQRNKQR